MPTTKYYIKTINHELTGSVFKGIEVYKRKFGDISTLYFPFSETVGYINLEFNYDGVLTYSIGRFGYRADSFKKLATDVKSFVKEEAIKMAQTDIDRTNYMNQQDTKINNLTESLRKQLNDFKEEINASLPVNEE